MTPSSSPDLRRYDVLFFKYTLILFLIVFPALIGISHSGPGYIWALSKNFEISYSSLNQIFPDIDTRYEHTSRPKGLKNLKAGFNLYNAINVKNNKSALTRTTHYYYPVNPEYISQYNFKAKVLFLDMPPPPGPV
jgi:hypothetical protein